MFLYSGHWSLRLMLFLVVIVPLQPKQSGVVCSTSVSYTDIRTASEVFNTHYCGFVICGHLLTTTCYIKSPLHCPIYSLSSSGVKPVKVLICWEEKDRITVNGYRIAAAVGGSTLPHNCWFTNTTRSTDAPA